MHKIRGTNVYPRAVEAIVREHREIDEFQIVLTREGSLDAMTVEIAWAETDDAAERWPRAIARLIEAGRHVVEPGP